MANLLRESFRRKRLAGIISESAYEQAEQYISEIEQNLSPTEKKIFDDIISEMMLNEAVDFNKVIEKVKKYAKGGLMTGALLAALLSNPAFSQSEKNDIKNAVETSQVEPGQDMVQSFRNLLDKTTTGADVVGGSAHSVKTKKTGKDQIVIQDTLFSYDSPTDLNPNVDLEDIAENIDSKVIQQKFNWIIKKGADLKGTSVKEIEDGINGMKKEFSSRFPDSKMDFYPKNNGGMFVFDHIFKQNDGFAQGPKKYKTIDGKIINVGERIPQGSHVVDFFAGKLDVEPQEKTIPGEVSMEDYVQVVMKPLNVEKRGTKEQNQRKVDAFNKMFKGYGEINTAGDFITLDPTYQGLVKKEEANQAIEKLNQEVQKIAKKYGFNFKGDVFHRADSVENNTNK